MNPPRLTSGGKRSSLSASPSSVTRTVSGLLHLTGTTGSQVLYPSATGGYALTIAATTGFLQQQKTSNTNTSTVALTLLAANSFLSSWDGTNYGFVVNRAAAGSGTTTATTFTASLTDAMKAGSLFIRNKWLEMIVWDGTAVSSGDQTTVYNSQKTYGGTA